MRLRRPLDVDAVADRVAERLRQSTSAPQQQEIAPGAVPAVVTNGLSTRNPYYGSIAQPNSIRWIEESMEQQQRQIQQMVLQVKDFVDVFVEHGDSGTRASEGRPSTAPRADVLAERKLNSSLNASVKIEHSKPDHRVDPQLPHTQVDDLVQNEAMSSPPSAAGLGDTSPQGQPPPSIPAPLNLGFLDTFKKQMADAQSLFESRLKALQAQ